MERHAEQVKEALRGAAEYVRLGGVLAIMAAAVALESRDTEQEPPDTNGQASEKGGPQGDVEKPFEPKENNGSKN